MASSLIPMDLHLLLPSSILALPSRMRALFSVLAIFAALLWIVVAHPEEDVIHLSRARETEVLDVFPMPILDCNVNRHV